MECIIHIKYENVNQETNNAVANVNRETIITSSKMSIKELITLSERVAM